MTPTEQRILSMLEARPCTAADLHRCLPDELTSVAAVKMHVSNLRKRLSLRGGDVVCRSGTYILVRMLCDDS